MWKTPTGRWCPTITKSPFQTRSTPPCKWTGSVCLFNDICNTFLSSTPSYPQNLIILKTLSSTPYYPQHLIILNTLSSTPSYHQNLIINTLSSTPYHQPYQHLILNTFLSSTPSYQCPYQNCPGLRMIYMERDVAPW